MDGSLNDILPEPIGPENERVLLDLLRRKMMVSLDLAVEVLHAMEARFGPEARDVIRDMAKQQEFEARDEVGEPEADLHGFCAMADAAAAGSHRWQRVTDERTEIGYQYTRCMYAEILRELGEPELGLVICARDEPWVRSYHPKLAFRRTKTLMEGADVCDHVFSVRR
ncbi:MAG: L-2-amino-thiazoline-4-carboxylic acid hydrolase [Actinomycetota bacterium]